MIEILSGISSHARAVQQDALRKPTSHADISVVNVRPDIIEIVVLSLFVPYSPEALRQYRLMVPWPVLNDALSPNSKRFGLFPSAIL